MIGRVLLAFCRFSWRVLLPLNIGAALTAQLWDWCCSMMSSSAAAHVGAIVAIPLGVTLTTLVLLGAEPFRKSAPHS